MCRVCWNGNPACRGLAIPLLLVHSRATGVRGDDVSPSKVYHTNGLCDNQEMAEYRVEGGTLRQMVNAYLAVIVWQYWLEHGDGQGKPS